MRNTFCRPFLVLSCLFLTLAVPLQASHEAGANLWWCTGISGITFHVTLAYNNFDQHPLGYPTIETFDFGDGTSAPITLTAAQLFAGQGHGWYLATGTVSHAYAPGTGLVRAGVAACCRPDGRFGTLDLNNRRAGILQAKVEIDPSSSALCPNSFTNLPLFWFRGKLGDTFEIPLSVHDHDPLRCRFATDAEAGGGPGPEGMTIDPGTCQITWTPTTGDPLKMWTAQVQAERIEGGRLIGSALIDFLAGIDGAPPLCQVDHIDLGPPVRLHILVQDGLSGIGGIAVAQADNAAVSIPPFQSGDGSPLDVVATKMDASRSSQVALRVVDAVGNVRDCDPILTEEVRMAGKPVSHTYPGIPPEEHIVTVSNGDPGLEKLDIQVNRRRFRLTGLRPGEERALDVAAAVIPGQSSTFTLTAQGRPGGRAAVLIRNGEL
jgi:hypothetical protein